jgi:hypothetical protein
MRAATLSVLLLSCFSMTITEAQSPPAAAAAAHYTTSDTEIGTLLDDPAAHAIVDKYLPGVLSGDQIDMARSMTLKAIQPYAADRISDEALAKIDADFAGLSAKK